MAVLIVPCPLVPMAPALVPHPSTVTRLIVVGMQRQGYRVSIIYLDDHARAVQHAPHDQRRRLRRGGNAWEAVQQAAWTAVKRVG